MKTHTSAYKNTIKTIGRQLDSKITYTLDGDTVELGSADLNSITPSFESNILKSAMKELVIDSNIEIPVGTIINYQLGVMVNNEFEYLDFGNYIVKEAEKQEDTRSYKVLCYDKMLYTMKDYENIGVTYPITIRSYIQAICDRFGLTFANSADEFVNYDKEIPNELYLDSEGKSLGYTFRDVMDELAQVTASTICINEDDELEIRYINDTEDTIDEQFLKDINVNFGEKYGPVNSIVLTRSADSDSIYLRDDESIEQNGLCEIKISDNQIMNYNNRDEYIQGLFDELIGLEYYLNDFASTGITYYDICDKYNVSVDGTIYPCIMFNDEILVTQGLQENIHTDLAETSETPYDYADKTDRRINQTYIIVNKQQGQIESLVSQQTETSEQLAQTIMNVNSIQNLFQITGGNNLIKDSQLLLKDEGLWEYGEPSAYSLFPGSSVYPFLTLYPTEYYYNESDYIGGYDATLIGKTVSIAKIGIRNGKMKTSTTNITGLILDTMYTLSFKISNDENTSSKIKLIGNGNVVYEETFDEPLEMATRSISFMAQTANYQLEIQSTSTTDGYVYVYDLMLNKGDIQTWEPAAGELVSTVIKLSQLGIQVYSSSSEIATLMTSEGFDIRRYANGTLYEIVTTFNKEGFISKKGVLEQLEIKGFDFKTISYQGYDTLILYKREGD